MHFIINFGFIKENKMMQKAVVVTGATGFIGGALTKKLLEQGTIVYGVGRDIIKMKRFYQYKNYIPVVADFLKYKELPQIIKHSHIEVFYHCAWYGGFTTALRDYHVQMKNVAYAGDALNAAKKIGCRKFVNAGTYNEFEIQTFLASDVFEPRYTCIYSTAKTAADLVCRTLAFNYGIDYCTGFIPMPYGEGNYSRQLTNIVIDSLNRGIAPKLIEGNNMYDLVYIDDIANAFIAIGEKGNNQKGYYIGHRELKTFKEWMIQIRNIVAPNVKLKFGEYKDSQNLDYSLIDLNALYNDTDFECKADFAESILKTAKWIKTNL